ncbi:hypothetical protein OsI_10668 [Oryza sativa Indica Group]|uniref:Uncharacterized protein n=1 Tax=Oryza sativa subsp. indica TaxID=39946 RepID=B8AJP3_ORYSI|nr:hypothetical protein OsI_10668 [Oryza sativa Indica Group]
MQKISAVLCENPPKHHTTRPAVRAEKSRCVYVRYTVVGTWDQRQSRKGKGKRKGRGYWTPRRLVEPEGQNRGRCELPPVDHVYLSPLPRLVHVLVFVAITTYPGGKDLDAGILDVPAELGDGPAGAAKLVRVVDDVGEVGGGGGKGIATCVGAAGAVATP